MIKALTEISSKTNFNEGQVLLFNKPLKWTSFDLVKKIRNTIKSCKNIKKIKVGHAGTLDPLANGLLIICTGKYTKRIESIQSQQKIYTGEITLGATTPSYDKETKINERFETCHITNALLHEKCKIFEGSIMQKPPIYSALKHKGKRLYEYARNGTKIKINARKVNIDKFEIIEINIPKIKFKVMCGKGTYIRSLVHDYGKSLNSGAHLSSLTREKIGEYNLKDAFSIESFMEAILK